MTDIIRLLPDSVANQIAAGEVIQRPASVVKELVENAIDAGSKSIDVYMKDAGRTQIMVIDDGCGMSETDARLCVERHATSKIKESKDLFLINTLGFRGEALASIAAIAELQLRSKRCDDELGTQVDISATQFVGQTPVQCPDGTTITVKNLFFNVPVRRKFLKSDSAEMNHVRNEFQRVALAYENISFSLTDNKTEIYRVQASNLKQRIVNLFGANIKQNLLNVETETSLITIHGYITKPEYAKKSFPEQFFFANGRFIKHHYLNKAILQAYEGIIPPEKKPCYFIYLETPPDAIDVNIHPTKTEVKFENEKAIFQILLSAVKQVLGKFNVLPTIDFDADSSIQIPVLRPDTQVSIPKTVSNSAYNPFEISDNYNVSRNQGWESLYAGFENEGKQEDKHEQTELFNNATLQTNTHLQLKGRYILTPVKSGLMIIDQKRAHERILFEQFQTQMTFKSSASQQCLFPETVELSIDEMTLFLELENDFAALGFDVRPSDETQVKIHGVPAETGTQNPVMVFCKLLDDFKEPENDLFDEKREKLAAVMAKQYAISYNKTLTAEEMTHLTEKLFVCNMPNFSPTGKIVIHIVKMEEIEGLF